MSDSYLKSLAKDLRTHVAVYTQARSDLRELQRQIAFTGKYLALLREALALGGVAVELPNSPTREAGR